MKNIWKGLNGCMILHTKILEFHWLSWKCLYAQKLNVFCQDFYQLHQANTTLNKEVEINGKSFKIIELYSYLDKVNGELVKIVVAIAKKYNFDIPLGLASQTTKMMF